MRLDQAFGVDLRSAALCVELDCNTVFDRTANRYCPRCGSAECYPLALWLDRNRRSADGERRASDTDAAGMGSARNGEWMCLPGQGVPAAAARPAESSTGRPYPRPYVSFKPNGSRTIT
jgi:hypothetical protein